MDRMVPEPRTFKELVEADLRRAARLIIKVQDEIDPQFRIATPEGDYHLAVTLARDPRDRMMMLRRVSAFMAWKKALGFVLASELHVPDCGPPPMKWSDSKYGFAIEEDCNGEEETQAGRDRCEVAAG